MCEAVPVLPITLSWRKQRQSQLYFILCPYSSFFFVCPLVPCCTSVKKHNKGFTGKTITIMRFEVITAVLLWIQVLWDVTSCQWVCSLTVNTDRVIFTVSLNSNSQLQH
jgi:hypothetical protein